VAERNVYVQEFVWLGEMFIYRVLCG
jgi:hypothetical protein